ncbi:UDP-glucuronosyltransferase [Rhyzopertha dominica]|nr:UDP-glucuronosyltransferase [Rhyzopertha dominica]
MSKTEILLLLLFVSVTQSARILGVFPTASISHQVVYQPIWRELSLRGHQVVAITPDPLKDPSLTNLTEIDLGFMYDFIRSMMKEFKHEQTHWDFLKMMPGWAVMMTELMFEHPKMVTFLNDTEAHFDLVIGEFLTPVVTAFAYKYKCPFIGVSSLSVVNMYHSVMGNPAHPILNPDLLTTFGEEMTFFEKVEAVIYDAYSRMKYINDLAVVDEVTRKYFGDDMPYLGELERNVSLLFVNTNPILHGARAFSPGVFELGRMHLKPKKPLPQDIKSFLDNAKEGVIYFSLGSNIKSNNIDERKRNIIMETFAELPYKVLWKFENEEMPNKPPNVKISKWLPQQDLLGHPNVKLFITQCGLQSTEEAIANETPMLGIPFIVDQHSIARRLSKLGIGLHLDFKTLTKDKFKTAILEIVENSKYKDKIKKINELMTDQPMTGLERFVWWTEYVLRHKGAPYFRNRVVDMPWYEYFLLDVIGFLLFVASLVIFVVYTLYKLLIRGFVGSRKLKTS